MAGTNQDTQSRPVTVERVRLVDSDITIEGSFALPPLSRLYQGDGRNVWYKLSHREKPDQPHRSNA